MFWVCKATLNMQLDIELSMIIVYCVSTCKGQKLKKKKPKESQTKQKKIPLPGLEPGSFG